MEEYQGLQEWFQMETEKYTAMIKHRHTAEIEAFTEQLRLKDEKLEAFRWRAVSMDVEATRLRSRIQELEGRLARHEKHSAGLEALLLDRANENRALEEQLETLQSQAPGVEMCTPAGGQDDGPDDHSIPCSPVKVVQRTMSSGSSRHQESTEVSKYQTKLDEVVAVSPEDHKEDWKELDVHATEALVVSVGDLACAAAAATSMEHDRHDAPASRQSFRSEIEEEKEVYTDPGNAQTTGSSSQEQEATSELALVVLPPGQKSSAWKTDIHALAVSYKIKRLKQQLLVLEKLANECKEEAAATKPSGSEASCSSSSRQQPRSRYHTMMSFLSKHVKRYQSLDDKIDDLCARMVRGGDVNRIPIPSSKSIPGSCVDVSVSCHAGGEQEERGAGTARRGGAEPEPERRAGAVPGGDVPAAAVHGGHGAEAAGDAVQDRAGPRARPLRRRRRRWRRRGHEEADGGGRGAAEGRAARAGGADRADHRGPRGHAHLPRHPPHDALI